MTWMEKIKIIQLNLNNSRAAADLLAKTAAEKRIEVAIVSEPARKGGRTIGRWYTSQDQKAGIIIINQRLKAKKILTGRTYVLVEIEDWLVLSCYLSPNEKWSDFTRQVEEIEDNVLRTSKTKPPNSTTATIVAGDFNARAKLWSEKTDRRGDRIEELTVSTDMVCVNSFGTPTFERRGQSSVIDATLVTAPSAGHVKNWKVLEEETLSDHRAIYFEVSRRLIAASQATQAPSGNKKRWIVSKINLPKLQALAEELCIPDEGELNASEMAEEITENTRKICDKVMPARRGERKKPVYWWNSDIAKARKDCTRMRRSLLKMRRKKNLEAHLIEEKEDQLRETRRALRKLIKRSKGRAWEDLIKTVDDDVWGMPYKLVRGKLSNTCQTPTSMEEAMEAFATLFPEGPPLGQALSGEETGTEQEGRYLNDEDSTRADIDRAVRKLKTRKAPGPDGIPPEVIKAIYRIKPAPLHDTIRRCMRDRMFPEIWKVADLLLIPKDPKPGDEPGMKKYRPISLISALAKILEMVIDDRVKKHVNNTGYVSDRQYGFREGRSTMDAIEAVTNEIKKGMKKSGWVAGVCIDIKNAFGSIPWPKIMEAAEDAGLPGELLDILISYLSRRKAVVTAGREVKTAEITRGVPQGSILGPTLWNLGYNKVLTHNYHIKDASLTCYADDTLLLVSGKTVAETAHKAARFTEMVIKQIEALDLQIAVEKTEVVFFTIKRTPPPQTITINGEPIHTRAGMRYLGVHLDAKLNYAEHVRRTCTKSVKTMNEIGRLMPNVGGPTQSRRRLLARVGESILMYGAQIWGEKAKLEAIAKELRTVHRACARRVAAAYRTASSQGLAIITGIQPFELTARQRNRAWAARQVRLSRQKTEGVSIPPKLERNLRKQEEKEAAEWAVKLWREEWDRNFTTGQWTKRLIPDLTTWQKRTHGQLNYHLTQMLTGHGAFNEYLNRFRRRTTAKCSYCNSRTDSAEHTIFKCQAWNGHRGYRWTTTTGEPLNPDNVVMEMLSNKTRWRQICNVISKILTTKEQDDREKGF